MVDPYFGLFNYQKLKPASTEIIAITPSPIDSALNWNKEGWIVKIDKLEIENGTFKNDAYTKKPTVAGFDGKHIEFKKPLSGGFFVCCSFTRSWSLHLVTNLKTTTHEKSHRNRRHFLQM